MCDYSRGKVRAYVPGGFEFVAGRDIAEGHVLAMSRGRTGHEYVFATAFHTLSDLIEMWREVVGTRSKPMRIPAGLMSAVSSIYSGALSRFFPNVPQRLTPGSIRILTMQRHADTTRARTELGWRPTTIAEAVRAAYEFFAEQGISSGIRWSRCLRRRRSDDDSAQKSPGVSTRSVVPRRNRLCCRSRADQPPLLPSSARVWRRGGARSPSRASTWSTSSRNS